MMMMRNKKKMTTLARVESCRVEYRYIHQTIQLVAVLIVVLLNDPWCTHTTVQLYRYSSAPHRL